MGVTGKMSRFCQRLREVGMARKSGKGRRKNVNGATSGAHQRMTGVLYRESTRQRSGLLL